MAILYSEGYYIQQTKVNYYQIMDDGKTTYVYANVAKETLLVKKIKKVLTDTDKHKMMASLISLGAEKFSDNVVGINDDGVITNEFSND